MKKYFILIVTLFMLSFTANVYSNECPSGYAETFVQMSINGCDYSVHICYNCTPSPSEYSSIRVFGYAPLNPNCSQAWTPDQIMQYIYGQVYTPAFFQNLCSSIPPCGQGGIYVDYIYEKCWEMHNHNGIIDFVPCNLTNCYCYELWLFCWDTLQQKWIATKVYGPSPSCVEDFCGDTQYSQVQQPRNGETSECFNLWTPCTW
ncbi:MAG: hypothetical protein HZB41_01815 [Ignavibacteriae bacterium]|nr:hypothetical protein [Ignavibacteriota bacterium]